MKLTEAHRVRKEVGQGRQPLCTGGHAPARLRPEWGEACAGTAGSLAGQETASYDRHPEDTPFSLGGRTTEPKSANAVGSGLHCFCLDS